MFHCFKHILFYKSIHTKCDKHRLNELRAMCLLRPSIEFLKSGLEMDFRSKFTYSSVFHSHTVLMKVCPCGRYRQL